MITNRDFEINIITRSLLSKVTKPNRELESYLNF